MARRRMIDPLIWEDEHFGRLSDKAKLLFIACISNADDDGRLSGNPSNLRAIAFRFNDMTLQSVEKLIQEVAEVLNNFLYYSVNGCNYIQLSKWEEYQLQRDDRRKPSRLPSADKAPQDDGKCPPKLSKDKIREVKLSKDKWLVEIDRIIEDLNYVLGSKYGKGSKNKELIASRLNEGFIFEDFKLVHRKMLKKWGADDKMSQYLRPETLYSNKFESYLNMIEPQTKLTQAGVKAYHVGQAWLEKEGALNG